MGCSVNELRRSTACHRQMEPGPTKCYKGWELNRDCEIWLNESGAKCNLDAMICKHVQTTQQQGVTTTTTTTQQQQNTNSGPSAVDASAAMAMYENPAGNTFFCGTNFQTITENCLQSKVRRGKNCSVSDLKELLCYDHAFLNARSNPPPCLFLYLPYYLSRIPALPQWLCIQILSKPRRMLLRGRVRCGNCEQPSSSDAEPVEMADENANEKRKLCATFDVSIPVFCYFNVLMYCVTLLVLCRFSWHLSYSQGQTRPNC